MQASWHESTMPPPFYKLTCSSSCVWERALLMQVHPCPVCKLEVGLPRMVPKTALRAREEFLYFECEDCGCLFLPESDGSMEETEPVVEWTPKSGPAAFVRRLMAGLHLWPPYMYGNGRSSNLQPCATDEEDLPSRYRARSVRARSGVARSGL